MEIQDWASVITNIAAMRLDFPVSDDEIALMAAEVATIPDSFWYWCTFRESFLLCLYGNDDVNNKTNMQWLSYASCCPTLVKMCEHFIFPMTTVRPRIIIIRTLPGQKMRPHTDCYPDQMHKLEPKLRLVLQGRQNSALYYFTPDGSRQYIPDDWRAYIMSGAALHGMDNKGDEKYTLCFGDPWLGDNLTNTMFTDYIQEQYALHSKSAITMQELNGVDHLSGVKDPTKEEIYGWDEWHRRTSN
jgi:hypothetical protein